jgi:hypothetical protein
MRQATLAAFPDEKSMKHSPGPAMTLGNMRELGALSRRNAEGGIGAGLGLIEQAAPYGLPDGELAD